MPSERSMNNPSFFTTSPSETTHSTDCQATAQRAGGISRRVGAHRIWRRSFGNYAGDTNFYLRSILIQSEPYRARQELGDLCLSVVLRNGSDKPFQHRRLEGGAESRITRCHL